MKKIVDKPDLYDLLYKEVTEDIYMYLKLLKDQKNILEFGAGTGRVTIPLAEKGHFVEAVDLSSKMLENLKNKIQSNEYLKSHINPILGNMCEYISTQKFNAILIPLTSFNYLLTDKEQEQCLLSVKNNLLKEGFAIIELLSKNTFLDTNKSDGFTFIKRIQIDDNSYYDYYRNTILDLEKRKIYQRRLFKYYINNQYVSEEELEWKNRFVTIEDFTELVNKVGLEIEQIYGNCNLDAYNPDSEDVFVKVRRKN